jgi:Tfp pilus assembly protein PilE
MRRFRFPWLEILLVIAACALIYIVGSPQYKDRELLNNRYKVRVNMYTLRAACEKYAAWNKGRFSASVDDISEFIEGELINPYTGKLMTAQTVDTLTAGYTLGYGDTLIKCDTLSEADTIIVECDTLVEGDVLGEGDILIKHDIQIFQYETSEGPKRVTPDSENGKLRGNPGTLAYGYYIAFGKKFPSAYGIVGFNEKGEPLAEASTAGGIKLVVLPNKE